MKSFLYLSNISFIVNTFVDNYTVAEHVQVSEEHSNLKNKLNTFSKDIMTLKIANLHNSANALLDEIYAVIASADKTNAIFGASAIKGDLRTLASKVREIERLADPSAVQIVEKRFGECERYDICEWAADRLLPKKYQRKP